MTNAVARPFGFRDTVRPSITVLPDLASCEIQWPEPETWVNHEGASRPHIALDSDEPGVRGLFRFRPETALPLNQLVEVLLCGESTLSRGERELIATYVSALNECRFCFYTHAAFTAVRFPEGMELVEKVRADLAAAPISAKLKALLAIAGAVQQSGRAVSAALVADARREGATDVEIHDTVLIAAAFCMFNRYVDGLGTVASDDPSHYAERAQRTEGYVAVLVDALRQE
ncbi:carboxymuconolactone decarboxylase family protein [Planomonospora sp. ID67723]|uniref:carboxymuconolactone decarboxylase family protein n=1 Tax=Planomonospora sp. ID67723 TaxID=2738134 RepID=UPI0018C45041|nr:carboxymuconolactone decarboxylase family protein [Planomonospora sp. ID67723]MBG0831961.1 carboxymuconolactone decarboxylase family protein [Planomonospora sp. ID67723]